MSGANPHVGLDVLAEHLEGLLDPAEATRVDEHLGSCALCAARVEDLRGVTSVLSADPAPTMPADVRERVEQAVRTELRAQGAPPAAAAEAATSVVSLEEQRDRRGRIRRALLVAAAAIVVVAGGSAVQDLGGPADDEGAATQAESAAESPSPRDLTDAAALPRRAREYAAAQPTADGLADGDVAVIEQVFVTRAGVPRRDRAACVGAALDDSDWVGTSYAVTVEQTPAAVAFLDHPGARTGVEGVLVTCEPTPAVRQRRPLTR